MIGDAEPETAPDAPPLLDVQVAVYPVIALPPSSVGVENATVRSLPALPTAVTAGALGTPITVKGSVGVDSGLSPPPFVVWTVQVYVLPWVKELTRMSTSQLLDVSGRAAVT